MSDGRRPLDFVAIPLSMRAEIWRHSTSDVGKAVRLAMFCAEQLNGGVIKNARKWTPSEWRSCVNFAKPLTQSCNNLFTFVGDDLVVHIYNPDYEKSVLSRRKTNSNNIKNRWGNNTIVSPKHNSTKEKRSKEKFVVVVDAATDRRGHHPDSFEELFDFLKKKYPNIPNEQLNDCAHAFMDAGDESEWRDSTGEPIHSWQATARGFAEKRIRRYSKSRGSARSRAEADERERRRAEILEELEGVWPADAQQS